MSDKLILVTNDDGYFSQGIRSLAKVASQYGRVYIVAPKKEQSAMSHSITISKSVFFCQEESDQYSQNIYSVDGTPVDSVKLAMYKILPRKPDLVLSGINKGANVGQDVLYSGTIAAAFEAARFGCQSYAFSACHSKGEIDWSVVCQVATEFLSKASFLSEKSQEGRVLSLNIPALPYKEIRGFSLATLSKSSYIKYKSFNLPVTEDKAVTDLNYIVKGYATISSLAINFIDDSLTSDLEDAFI